MPRNRFLVLIAITFVALLAISAACGDDDASNGGPTGTADAPAEPDSITFMPGFKPQANLPFVGAYVADEKGYFADENLDVTIQHVTTPGDNFRFLAAGEVQITTADASALLEHRASDPPIDLVSLALIGQRGQQGFAVLADSGIEAPADWVGKTAGYKGSQVTPDYLAILGAVGVDRDSVQEVRVGFEPQILTEGQVDIYPVFVSNEPDTLRRLGYETRVFEAADYGAPTLGLTYVATGDYVEEHPDIVKRFLRAVLKGIQYAEANEEEAIDIVLEFAPEEDPDHQAYMLETELGMARSAVSDASGIGWQTEEQWQQLHDYMVQYGALSGPLDDINDAFTDEFLSDIYAGGSDLLE
jgi:ABC-type nitrate/sulfonate/bicarbonate transport system substrate-binding protein